MQSVDAGNVSTIRLWIATVAVILLVVAVWKFIDFRMAPPPPKTALPAETAPL